MHYRVNKCLNYKHSEMLHENRFLKFSDRLKYCAVLIMFNLHLIFISISKLSIYFQNSKIAFKAKTIKQYLSCLHVPKQRFFSRVLFLLSHAEKKACSHSIRMFCFICNMYYTVAKGFYLCVSQQKKKKKYCFGPCKRVNKLTKFITTYTE